VAGVHVLPPPHRLGVPAPPQTPVPAAQVPQSRMPPQPFAIGPHAFAGHVDSGMHDGPPMLPPPHTFAVPPPPQIAGAWHVPPQL
jgi:hypothetical protein